ncbi:hypothetical protein EK21DRAFT_109575 [Setomelanomma holmii]|uniref:Heterokaryon incompatibility domain-containing protein n=1 Tax=Setomelanomma holmii TaxID=210430 RepID=A0A9P4HDL9_9PLEO|nr:hypothetical protein EK21DRAFT_109575 [Setomelanomma holmii]
MRLIRVKTPGRHSGVFAEDEATDTQLKVQIDHVSIDRWINYIAPSYTWGEVQKRRIMVEDGGETYELEIRENLYEALVAISPVYPVLWADAICINHNDIEEKGQQIQQMWRIYHNASYVAAWLE